MLTTYLDDMSLRPLELLQFFPFLILLKCIEWSIIAHFENFNMDNTTFIQINI